MSFYVKLYLSRVMFFLSSEFEIFEYMFLFTHKNIYEFNINIDEIEK